MPDWIRMCARNRQTDRQTDNLYLNTMVIKAVQLMGSSVNTKLKNNIFDDPSD